MLLGMQPRVWLACWAASGHWQVILSFSSPSTCKSFSTGLLSIHFPPSLYLCLSAAEGALNPTVRVSDKDVKRCQFQYQPLRNTTHHWSPLGHHAIDHNSLSATIQPIAYPLRGLSIKSMSLQFTDKDVMWDSVKFFAQVQVDDISCSASPKTCQRSAPPPGYNSSRPALAHHHNNRVDKKERER